jgi:hypothetical protein
MKQIIYKIFIYDAEENTSLVDPLIFWDKAAAIKEADRIHSDSDIVSDSVYVYEEEADRETGAFRTKALIYKTR